MMKIQIIETLKGDYDLQQKVNDFIKNKNVVNVSYSVVECGDRYMYSCCVLYRE